MNCNQPSARRGLALTLVLAFIVGLLAFGALRALPAAAADGFPNCGKETASLPPTGPDVFTVTGAVISYDGTTPVECVEIFAFSGARQTFTYTNSSGRYTLTLSAGIYDFAFHPPLETRLASQLRRWVREAQVLNVTLPPGYIISGTVYSEAMKTKPMSNVNIFAANPDTFVGLGFSPSGVDGTYLVSLEKGRWELTFAPPHFLGLGPTRTEVISLSGDITRHIILQPGFTITGTVTATSSGEGVANVDIFAEDPDAPQGLKGFGITATDANGLYTGTLPAGDFDILFFAPPFSGLGSTVVTNVVGPPDRHLDVALPAGYTVSGTVKCGDGIPNAFVHAAPEPPVSAGRLGGWGRFTGIDGYYALALQPGVYTFTVDWPSGGSPDRIVPVVQVAQDMILDFGACIYYFPLILKNWRFVPWLYPIANGGDGNYVVSWLPPSWGGPHTYTLAEDDVPAFSSPNMIGPVSGLSYTITGRVHGTYYYRVKVNSSEEERGWSNTQAATVTFLTIDDFDDGQDPNNIGGPISRGWPVGCGTPLTDGYVPDGSGGYYYLSYNVTPPCYAVWQTDLLGQDYSWFSSVTFRIKGALGNEQPHVWLQDTSNCLLNPACRHYASVGNFLPAGKLTTDWQQASIPLNIFEANGVNLMSLKFFQMAFEWATINGTIYIDDIRFE